ncbi:hypothetical protein ICJ85_04395 [Aestuariibaculum marinum]|uniref:Toxin-antitoxin system YwqK family antitoxin n=1 Tax=Aestuariibaculum marinum TaxID=2683592 RepID=A0A8J6PSS9_9FLAO|nr:hypothetical protein [Aestuariibaculum marinum]
MKTPYYTLKLITLLILSSLTNCKNTPSESDFKLIGRSDYYVDAYDGISYYRNSETHEFLDGYFVVGNKISKWEEFNTIKGILNGENIVFHNNGNIFSKTEYKNGRRHGEERLYSPSGNLTTLNHYRNDVKYGKSYLYFENGDIQTELKIKNGNVIESITYNSIGEMVAQMFIEDGKKITQHLKNGILFSEQISSTYDNFEATKLYNEDGSLKLFIQMKTQGDEAFIIERDENGKELKRINVKENPQEVMKYQMLFREL